MSINRKVADQRIKRALVERSKRHWRRCFWTRPFGHDYRRRRDWDPIACSWCGRPYTISGARVYELIQAAETATGCDLDDGLVPEETVRAWRETP